MMKTSSTECFNAEEIAAGRLLLHKIGGMFLESECGTFDWRTRADEAPAWAYELLDLVGGSVDQGDQT